MKNITKFLNWLGIYTKKQHNTLLNIIKDDIKDMLRLKTTNNAYINELKKNLKGQPFEFDYLLNLYTKDQLNALEYKMINHVRNNESMRDLLEIWKQRIINAKETILPNNPNKKDVLDYK